MESKELAKQVTEAVVDGYDFKHEIDASIEELIGIDGHVADEDIIALDE
ncbi:MAG: hypothetical protein GY866_27105 [Proteobacteria bacterium]|nr:hypothetical protein [Pseudomonadota bacterium]